MNMLIWRLCHKLDAMFMSCGVSNGGQGLEREGGSAAGRAS